MTDSRKYSDASKLIALIDVCDVALCLWSSFVLYRFKGNASCFTFYQCVYLIDLRCSFFYPVQNNTTFLVGSSSRWKSFKRQMLNIRAHSDSKGIELKRPNDSIYSFPCPDCMCKVNKTEDSRSSSAT